MDYQWGYRQAIETRSVGAKIVTLELHLDDKLVPVSGRPRTGCLAAAISCAELALYDSSTAFAIPPYPRERVNDSRL